MTFSRNISISFVDGHGFPFGTYLTIIPLVQCIDTIGVSGLISLLSQMKVTNLQKRKQGIKNYVS